MFGALTSVGIQRRFIRMLNSRENFTFIEEYFLLDTSDKKMFRKVFLINLHSKRFPIKKTKLKVKITPIKIKIIHKVK